MKIKKQTILEVDRNSDDRDVEQEVRQLWRDMELGNDTSYYAWDQQEDAHYYPCIAEYVAKNNLQDEDVLIHFWW